MFCATLTVNNPTGLHARPASDLVALCQQFQSEVMLYTEEEEINAKSIISILAGGVMQGESVRLEVEGEDEEAAGNAVVDYINGLAD